MLSIGSSSGGGGIKLLRIINPALLRETTGSQETATTDSVRHARRSIIALVSRPPGLNLPPETNPADWILDMTTSSQKLRDGKPLHEAYQHHMARPTTASHVLQTPTSILTLWYFIVYMILSVCVCSMFTYEGGVFCVFGATFS